MWRSLMYGICDWFGYFACSNMSIFEALMLSAFISGIISMIMLLVFSFIRGLMQ